jgi:alcohol dehydrogenase class IV
MQSFVYKTLPQRVVFNAGARHQIGAELTRLGIAHALVLTTPRRAELGQSLLQDFGNTRATAFAEARMHTPVDVTEAGMQVLAECGADGIVSIGGGSTVGLGKALSLRSGLPHVTLPTTYSGSEMTDILGETFDGRKTTRRAPDILPETVIYDVELMLSLPVEIAGVSGMNALAHAVEALYAPDANPITDLMALEAIRVLSEALPALVKDPGNIGTRSDALYGAWLCGSCLGAVSMSLHHKICHTLGGTFDLPHAETHTVMLPHALAYNAPAIPEVMARLGPILGCDPARALFDLSGALGATRGLKDIGMPEDGITQAAKIATQNAYANPRPVEIEALTQMLRRAWSGAPPQS